MNDASKKLSIITEVWNSFFLEYKYCQKKINYTDDVRTNYFGDILHYFRDTFGIIYYSPNSAEFSHFIFNTISLMQTIYIQQDLIEELLYIFKFDKDKMLKDSCEYQFNRKIRNELIGHPIRRTVDNKFISSVFWGRKLSNENIHYILYNDKTGIAGQDKQFERKIIVSYHQKFVNSFFELILQKIAKIIIDFKKNITKIENSLSNTKDFKKHIQLLEDQYERIFTYDYLYKKEVLINIFERSGEHPRYQLIVEMFYFDLNEFIQSTYAMVSELIQKINEVCESVKDVKNDNKCFYTLTNLILPKLSNFYDYEISTLSEKKHPDYSLQILKGKYNQNNEILNELDFIEKNIEDQLEFYASINYLKYLILNIAKSSNK